MKKEGQNKFGHVKNSGLKPRACRGVLEHAPKCTKIEHFGHVKAIIFDLDGTLINSLPYHVLSFKDLLLEHGIRLEETYLKKLVGMSTRAIFKELEKKYKFKENIDELREERRYHYFKFIGSRDLCFPGVKKMLRKLKLNYKLAIATGSSFVVFSHSTDKDFQEMFDEVVTINKVKKHRGKPFPDQLIFAAKKLREKPENCIMVGDSVYDIIAAKRAGMKSIGVLTGYTSKSKLLGKGASLVLDKASEVSRVLK